MRRSLFSVLIGTVLCFGALTCAAQAQAYRTWLSAVGDDTNPCTRVAPCKTLAGAYPKTFAGGEIDVLDAGGFGALTIDKAITIDGGAVYAAVLVGSGTAISVSAGPNDIVRLKNLQIQGNGGASIGITFFSGHSLHVEHCMIQNFTADGIEHSTPASPATFLTVEDSIIENSSVGLLTSSSLSGMGPNPNRVAIKNTSIINNGSTGINVSGNTSMQIKNVLVAGNGFSNNLVAVSSGQGTDLNIEDSIVTNNNNGGLFANTGSIMRVSNTTVTNNNGTGVSGLIFTYGNNRVSGNRANGGSETNGTFSGTVPLT